MAYHLVAGIGPWPIISYLGSVHGLSSHRDDEDVVNAMKMSISHVKIPDGQTASVAAR